VLKFTSIQNLLVHLMADQTKVLLPPELWIAVFRHATYLPGCFDTAPLPPLQFEPRSWDMVQPYSPKMLLRTKSNLSRVSRLWKELSSPFLYEHLYISSPYHLFWISNALKQDFELSQSPDSASTPHAFYVRRIDIRLEEIEQYLWVKGVATLLSMCANIKVSLITTLHDFKPMFPVIIPIIQAKCPNLRHIYWNDFQFKNSLIHWLPSLSTIEVLIIHDYLVADAEDWRVPDVFLPNVHTMEIDDLDGYDTLEIISGWRVPSLRRLAVSVDFATQNHPLPFFERFGPSITSLDLRDSEDPDIPYILSCCTSLLEMTISS
jgi:hypothetical protein